MAIEHSHLFFVGEDLCHHVVAVVLGHVEEFGAYVAHIEAFILELAALQLAYGGKALWGLEDMDIAVHPSADIRHEGHYA